MHGFLLLPDEVARTLTGPKASVGGEGEKEGRKRKDR